MVVKMRMKENKEFKPILLKLGLALALSFAGFIYAQLRSKKLRALPRPPPSSGGDKMYLNTKMGLECALRFIQATPSCGIAAFVAPENHEVTSHANVSIDRLFPSNEHSEDEEKLIFPEFNEPLKDYSSANTDISTPTTFKKGSEKETNQEITNLKNMVQVLREREMKLEIELLEYYGLKEQETAVMELENRLKINNVEAKFYALKIESLQADKQRMEAQMVEHSKVKSELESAKTKIKLLKRKIKSNAEHSKEQISSLQQKVKALLDQEHKTARRNEDIESKLKRLNELEEESAELRRTNSLLQSENSDLATRLQSTQILASFVLEAPKDDSLQEASNNLRLENENLTKEIEQLHANNCADVEELVYLRWINACLRYELRHQHVPPGKTVARNLSKTLSPKSSEKAKQLILEYASLEELGDKGVSLMDIDSDYWSSSRNSNSNFTESTSEFDDSSNENISSSRTNSSTKSKLYGKLKRLVRKKDNTNNNESAGKRESASTSSMEDMMSPTIISRKSSDIKRARSFSLEDMKGMESDRRSDVGCLKMTVLREEDDDDMDLSSDVQEKLKLMKFAKALKESNGTPKSMSFSTY